MLNGNSKEWKFSQWFKKMPTQGVFPDADILSSLQFDDTGEFLATGDRGGRVVLLRSDGDMGQPTRNGNSNGSQNGPTGLHYKFHCEFQSHEQEFDYVRSLNIEERVNKIRFLKRLGETLFLLTTNDRVIKLWKIREKDVKSVQEWNVNPSNRKTAKTITQLKIPKSKIIENLVVADCKRIYAQDVHQFHINSLATNVDGETFLSADNLRINLWNIEMPAKSFNIVDTKPKDMADLSEVITACDVHRVNCHEFCYSTSKGSIKLMDMRSKALCDDFPKIFSSPVVSGEKPFFSDVTQTITDVKFSRGGRFIVSRDFMTLKIWDVAMENQPVETICVHEYLRSRLWDLYDNESIYDSFELAMSADGNIVTGSYNNLFHVMDMKNKTDTWVEASKLPLGVTPIVTESSLTQSNDVDKKKKRISRSSTRLFSRKSKNKTNGPNGMPRVDPDQMDFEKKVLQVGWHPEMEAVAVAGANNLFLYSLQ